jgi:hypothetical protein
MVINLSQEGRRITELTEDLLERIASTIADLRLRVNLLQQMVMTKRGKRDDVKFDAFEKQVAEYRGTAEYRQIYGDVLGTLKGGH